jgi:hypothetical protein
VAVVAGGRTAVASGGAGGAAAAPGGCGLEGSGSRIAGFATRSAGGEVVAIADLTGSADPGTLLAKEEDKAWISASNQSDQIA